MQVTLTASATNVLVGTAATLTATATADVGPTRFDIWIYDVTSGTEIARVVSGTSVSVTVSEPTVSTHSYVAYISLNLPPSPPAFFPPVIEDASDVVSISWSTLVLSLGGQAADGTHPLMVHSAVDVTTNPNWYITLFENSNGGTRLGMTGFGTTLAASVHLPINTVVAYQAYISGNSPADPPSGLVYSSNPVVYLNQVPT
jgi:hypothetical protein